jgi:hypothetical protein
MQQLLHKLLHKIKETKNELNKLNHELNEFNKNKYSFIIGKFFSLSATEIIKVIDIINVDYDYIYVECLSVYGGECNLGNIEINISDYRNLKINDIDENRIIEISKDQFIKCINESLDLTKNIVLSSI